MADEGAVRYHRDVQLVPRLAVVALPVALFLSALAFPAVGTCTVPGTSETNWFENENIVLFGWLAMFVGQAGWFANIPFFWNAMSLLRDRPPRPLLIALQGSLVVIAIVSLQPAIGMRLPHNEGFDEPVCRLGRGFWLWVAAHASMIAAAIGFALLGRRAPSGEDFL